MRLFSVKSEPKMSSLKVTLLSVSALLLQVTAVSRDRFYPSGDKCILTDNGFSAMAISLNPPLPYYGGNFTNCVVSCSM